MECVRVSTSSYELAVFCSADWPTLCVYDDSQWQYPKVVDRTGNNSGDVKFRLSTILFVH